MKLRNKKTGEITELYSIRQYWREKEDGGVGYLLRTGIDETSEEHIYNSLAEFYEEWEDYEDELFYVISSEHKSGYQCVLKDDYPEICNVAKELGIGFENEKDCKKAVEKLKAWKRLKDKGFRFEGINEVDGSIKTGISKGVSLNECEEFYNDMIILFGGEDE